MTFILQWLDLAWVPAALLVVHRHQRWIALGFFAGSMLMMRLLIECAHSLGIDHGLTGLIKTSLLVRALIVYSLSYMIYIGWLYVMPKAYKSMLMAGSLLLLLVTAGLCSVVMVL